ncbi:hypothetical protein G7Y89_g14387 [Cudoniella acicularis]|uniref:Uncharacterized protein n=1 Tax=Cudoniella acicularis TaxID=354080 RepID=A0A8H4VTI8_9HELO|nr:hypothetical protein G7Y89_g14387 [Cudoniella acicularis]
MGSVEELALMPTAFPKLLQTSGLINLCRLEGEVQHLEIIGSIAKEIDGTFYRVMPDPQFPSFAGDDSFGEENYGVVDDCTGPIPYDPLKLRSGTYKG